MNNYNKKDGIFLQVYLDNSATTPVDNGVREAMEPFWQEHFGNPSSPHHLGVEAENALSQCRRFLAQSFGVKPSELFFTSGGTEANNLAILGFGRNQRTPAHIITTSIEHPSVLHPIANLAADYGWQVTKLDVDQQGLIDLDDFAQAIRPETRFISIMLVNNEIGAVQDFSQISNIITAKSQLFNNKIIFHADACQALGVIPINILKHKIDLLSLSGHKIFGPKGTGLLYCSEQVKLKPLVFGGGQENGMRSGTENLPGIIGFTKACQLALQNNNLAMLTKLRERLVSKLKLIPKCYINSTRGCAPHIVNVRFSGIKAEVLIHFLEQKGVYVSMGAACSSKKPSVSHVLQAIGLTKEETASSIRISLSTKLSDTDIDYAAEVIKTAVDEIRTIYS